MSLRNQLERNGSWLFRHRSYLPLVTIPVFLACLPTFTYLGASHTLNEFWQIFCLMISFAGLAVRIVAVGRAPIGTSGRNTREQVAQSLTTTGIYSVVRHPLYLGNYLILLGMALWPHLWWLAALTTCVFALYYERIMLAEEAFLRGQFGDAFEAWAVTTPAFIPRLHGWKPSLVSFSWRTVLQREYNAFIVIIGVFFVFDVIGDWVAERRWHVDYGWFAFFIAGFAIFATLRTIKKRTRLLHVEGR
ncbi:MAG TPA: isoprenylcysteine carboxylmethyltransferase family protein [Candidatus Cybelea sp.]|nr:isoprenylcysteine carboxylmethyltransferase family protein [Candidatus Cybelea sp.]